MTRMLALIAAIAILFAAAWITVDQVSTVQPGGGEVWRVAQ